VEAFVRPHGLAVAATPLLVAAIEQACARPAPTPQPRPRWAQALQPLMTPIMRWTRAAQNRARRRLGNEVADGTPPRRETEPLTPKQAVRLGIRLALRVRPLRQVAANLALPLLEQITVNGHQAPGPLRPGLAYARQKLETALTETSLIQRLDYDKAEILLLVRSKAESKRLQSCAKEPWTVEWIEQWVQPGEVLYDIGANIGAYSLVAARHTRGKSRIIAVEPGYGSFSALCQNVVLNECTESITPLPINLGPATGLGRFQYRDLRAGAADHGFSTDKRNGSEALYEQPVLTYRLDDLIEQFGLPAPTHIKLDVDGAEIGVLEGAEATLGSPSLRSILIEVNPRQSEAAIEALSRHGLELKTKFTTRQGLPMSVWYGLFTPVAVRV
jgi:FkbM family methyltransferase